MASLVVDCSVTLTWFFEDETVAYAENVLTRLGSDRAVVPVLWKYEVANGLSAAERRKRLTHQDVINALSALAQLDIETDDSEPIPSTLVEVASHHRLTAYDAAYLEVAARRGLPLATLDQDLAEAARQVGVLLKDG